MALPVYSSRDVNITWGGVPITGLAADSFVEIAPSADETDEDVGSDGELATSINPDRTGSITIRLQQTSPSNLMLSGILADQRAGGRKFKRGNLTVTDPSGSVMAFLKGAYIKTKPNIILGNTQTGQTRDWVFFCEEVEYTSAPDMVAEAIKNTAADAVAAAIATLDGLNQN